jgi:hypothetical protein
MELVLRLAIAIVALVWFHQSIQWRLINLFLYAVILYVILGAGFIFLIFFLAVLFLAIVGPKLDNSPWLYVTAFGLMSCIGILAIKPKFDQRERSIENKYIGRVAANDYLAKKSDPKSTETAPQAAEANPRPPTQANGPIYKLPPDQNGKTVDFLLVICGLATITGAGMLIYTVQHQQLARERGKESLA